MGRIFANLYSLHLELVHRLACLGNIQLIAVLHNFSLPFRFFCGFRPQSVYHRISGRNAVDYVEMAEKIVKKSFFCFQGLTQAEIAGIMHNENCFPVFANPFSLVGV